MSQDFSIDVDEDLCSILSLGMNGDSVWGGAKVLRITDLGYGVEKQL
jgi:hypothetical protein